MKKSAGKKSNPEVKINSSSKTGMWISILTIIIIVLYCYSPSLSVEKEFTNWDDTGYVTNQSLIRSSESEKVDSLFSTSNHVMLNYHPLTMLTLAYNYSQSGLEISSYLVWNTPHAC